MHGPFFLRKTLNFSWIFCKMSEGEGRMNKMYQRLKRKCISLVLFALLVAFIVPYYAYAADNGAEPATAASAAGDYTIFLCQKVRRQKVRHQKGRDGVFGRGGAADQGRCRCINKYEGRCTGKYTRADINKKREKRLSVRICSLEEVMVFMLRVHKERCSTGTV